MKLDIFVGNRNSMRAFTRGFFERTPSLAVTPIEHKYLYCGDYRFLERDYNDQRYRDVFDSYFKAAQRKNPDFKIIITEHDDEN